MGDASLQKQVDRTESALMQMKRQTMQYLQQRPVVAATGAAISTGTAMGLAWLEKVHPTRAQALGVPLSAWVALAGIGGGLFCMLSGNKELAVYGDPLVAAGTGAACRFGSSQVDQSESIKAAKAAPPAATTGCWSDAEVEG